jgi:large subunit ribosomal protein L23
MNMYDVIIRPLSTEKSLLLVAEKNQFTFEVHMDANKIEIKNAVETIFDVDVLTVTTVILPKKMGRRGRKITVRNPAMKKAIVTLPKGQTIPLFNT